MAAFLEGQAARWSGFFTGPTLTHQLPPGMYEISIVSPDPDHSGTLSLVDVTNGNAVILTISASVDPTGTSNQTFQSSGGTFSIAATLPVQFKIEQFQ